MRISTPAEIKEIAWEGPLEPATTTKGSAGNPRPVVTIGRPEVWPAAEALKNELGQVWTPPLGGADFWLVRLACSLREPPGLASLGEAEQALYLRPKNHRAKPESAYAFSLYPDRLTAESKTDFTIGLGPALKFGGAELELAELGAKIAYRKVFPVIQSYQAGTPTPYWLFRPHAAHPLAGDQFVYAVLAATGGAGGIRAAMTLTVTIETDWGPLKLAPPEEAKANLRFSLP